MVSRKNLQIGAITLVGVVFLVLAGVAISLALRQQPTAVDPSQNSEFVEPGSVPIGGPFSLADHTGKTVTDKDFEGEYLLVFFGFTYCPDICPTTLSEIARTMDLLGDEAGAVQPLFITVDPERDTPEIMAEYVAAFHPAIIGLTGTLDQTAAVAKAYRLYYEKAPAEEGQTIADSGGYTVNHQGNTYLMNPEGEYLRHFSYGTPPEEMASSIGRAIDKFGVPGTEGT